MRDLAERIAERIVRQLDIGNITHQEHKALVAAIDDEIIRHLERERDARRGSSSARDAP